MARDRLNCFLLELLQDTVLFDHPWWPAKCPNSTGNRKCQSNHIETVWPLNTPDVNSISFPPVGKPPNSWRCHLILGFVVMEKFYKLWKGSSCCICRVNCLLSATSNITLLWSVFIMAGTFIVANKCTESKFYVSRSSNSCFLKLTRGTSYSNIPFTFFVKKITLSYLKCPTYAQAMWKSKAATFEKASKNNGETDGATRKR